MLIALALLGILTVLKVLDGTLIPKSYLNRLLVIGSRSILSLDGKLDRLTGCIVGQLLLQGFHIGNRGSFNRRNDIALLKVRIRSSAAIDDLRDVHALRHVVCTGNLTGHADAADSKISSVFLCHRFLGLLIHQILNDRNGSGDRNGKAHAVYLLSADLTGVDADHVAV